MLIIAARTWQRELHVGEKLKLPETQIDEVKFIQVDGDELHVSCGILNIKPKKQVVKIYGDLAKTVLGCW